MEQKRGARNNWSPYESIVNCATKRLHVKAIRTARFDGYSVWASGYNLTGGFTLASFEGMGS
jgi:hypothetical protein